MNPAFAYLASGESLYAGGLLLISAVSSRILTRRGGRVRNIAAWLALILMAAASDPFPWIIAATFLLTFALWFVGCNSTRFIPARLLIPVCFLLVIQTLALILYELPHRAMPKITGQPSDHLVVIGDSISSGLDAQTPPWPSIMQDATHIPVVNFARAGATTREARDIAEQLSPGDHVVLVEIGGNDLLAGNAAKVFEQDLNQLLSKIHVPGRTIVMFELPLLPGSVGYGHAQRRVAQAYGVWLIPKRYLASVLGESGSTSDGLHLSKEGARRMATVVIQALAPVLKP